MKLARQPRASFGCAIACAFLVACGDRTEPMGPQPQPQPTAVGVVLGSTDLSLTIFEVDDPSMSRQVGLGPDGSPVTMAVRGELAVVPLGLVPAVAVVDLESATLLRTIALPIGSGATGAAFVNDSIALVGNPELGTVSPVNVLRGTTGTEIAVGRWPQAIVVAGGRAYVLNAELENFAPAGPATVSVVDAITLQVANTISLSGENAGAGVVGPDGRLYVLHSGSFGAADGSLSAVNLASEVETENHPGFGDFPGGLAFGPDGDLYVSAFSYGLAIWNVDSDTFVQNPENAIAPDGVRSVSGVGFDASGRLYTLSPDCVNPSVAYRLATNFTVAAAIPVGSCPIAIAFTEVDQL